GHNQTDAASTNPSALFVAPGSDFHERAGAATIDAGSASGIESTDLDGKPRLQGSAPDIGAYETARPPAQHCVVPKLKGKTLKQARKALRKAHCKLGKVKRPKHSKHKRLVVRSLSVKAGTILADGARVGVKLKVKRHKHK
ncbi:MAG: PASTA domain-containing protein, partial [Solirubrobacterales bacterium]|nr:PASTA domain-containing protein [Solirubrobacterales bacterium]